MLKKLLSDEAGFIVSTELILVATILVIGLIVGHTTLRDQVVTELADGADAISALDHSYSYEAISITGVGEVAGTTFSDAGDFCDTTDGGAQGLGDTNTCVAINGGTAAVNGAPIVSGLGDSSN